MKKESIEYKTTEFRSKINFTIGIGILLATYIPILVINTIFSKDIDIYSWLGDNFPIG